MICLKSAFFILLGFSLMQCASHSSTNQATQADTSAVKTKPLAAGRRILFPSIKLFQMCIVQAAPYSYALFLPKNYNQQSKFPVIIFFDPHGKGNLPLAKYSYLANEFNCILIGSNDSKNGLTENETDAIANALILEAATRFPADEKSLTLAGFSGGGKVALANAVQNTKVTAVVYDGAATDLSSARHNIPILGFAGTDDMNYTDLMSFDQSLQKTPFPHLLIEWNGKHEWPDSITFRDAFYFILFNQMKAPNNRNEAAINRFIEEKKEKLAGNDILVKAGTYGELIFMLQGLTDVSPYEKALQQLMTSAAFKKAIDEKSTVLATEGDFQSEYVQAFRNNDLAWWKQEISRLQNDRDPKHAAMNQRLLGFISLACFTISGNAIQSACV